MTIERLGSSHRRGFGRWALALSSRNSTLAASRMASRSTPPPSTKRVLRSYRSGRALVLQPNRTGQEPTHAVHDHADCHCTRIRGFRPRQTGRRRIGQSLNLGATHSAVQRRCASATAWNVLSGVPSCDQSSLPAACEPNGCAGMASQQRRRRRVPHVQNPPNSLPRRSPHFHRTGRLMSRCWRATSCNRAQSRRIIAGEYAMHLETAAVANLRAQFGAYPFHSNLIAPPMAHSVVGGVRPCGEPGCTHHMGLHSRPAGGTPVPHTRN